MLLKIPSQSDFFPLFVVAEVVDPKDVPLVVLAQQEWLRKFKGKKKVIIQCELSRQGRPNPIPRSGGDERGVSLPRK